MFNGKKTYILAGLFLVAVLVPVIFTVMIPEWIYGILGALGLGALRLAIADISGNQGWKTYLAAVAVAVISILTALGVALPFDIELVYGVLGALGVAGVRDAVTKLI